MFFFINISALDNKSNYKIPKTSCFFWQKWMLVIIFYSQAHDYLFNHKTTNHWILCFPFKKNKPFSFLCSFYCWCVFKIKNTVKIMISSISSFLFPIDSYIKMPENAYAYNISYLVLRNVLYTLFHRIS